MTFRSLTTTRSTIAVLIAAIASGCVSRQMAKQDPEFVGPRFVMESRLPRDPSPREMLIQPAAHFLPTPGVSVGMPKRLLTSQPAAQERVEENPRPPAPGHPARQTVSLEALEQMALANHPGLRQAAAMVEQIEGARYQSGRPANPQVSLIAEDINEDGAAGRHGIELRKLFVRKEKLAANENVLGWEAERFRHMQARRELQVLTDLRLAYIEALGVQRQIGLLKELENAATKIQKITQRFEKAGDASQADVAQIETVVREAKLRRQAAEVELNARRQAIAALVGVDEIPSGKFAGVSGEDVVESGFDDLAMTLLTTSPQVKAAQALVQRAEARWHRECVLPRRNVTGSLGLVHDFAGQRPLVSLRVGVPLRTQNNNRGAIASAHAAVRAARANLDRIEQSLRARLADAFRDYQRGSTLAKGYRKQVIPKAQDARKKIEAAFGEGEATLLQLLQTQQAEFAARGKLITAEIATRRAKALLDGLLETGGLSPARQPQVNAGLRDGALQNQ